MKLGILRIRIAAGTSCTLLLLLSGSPPSSTPAQAPNPELSRQLQTAQQRYQAGDLDGAILAYQQAIRLNPQSGLAYSSLGSALLDKNNPKDAVAALEQAVKDLKTDPRAIEKIAREELILARPGEIIIKIPQSQLLPQAFNTRP